MSNTEFNEVLKFHMDNYPNKLLKQDNGDFLIPGGLDVEAEGDDFIIDENHNHYWKDEAISIQEIKAQL